jgi:hypothetical protein
VRSTLTVRGRVSAVLVGSVACLSVVASTPAQATTTVSEPLRSAVRALPVAAHSHVSTYDRTRDFGSWITQYGECDTRAVVLKDESLRATTQNKYCTVQTGKWFSYYNARYYTSAYGGALQIDHTVPVENAWISGAWRWTHATRVRFYNDLGDSRSLVAVDAHDNEAKGASDPTQWLPSSGRCRYVRSWVAVKLRWRLTVTSGEKSRLQSLASGCTNTTLTVRRAL